jgi:hypothetical protein
MAFDPLQPGAGKSFEQKLRELGDVIETDARRVITYLNDEVVPDIRRNSSEALRVAAAELQKLAQRMDDARGSSTSAPPNAAPPYSGPDDTKL